MNPIRIKQQRKLFYTPVILTLFMIFSACTDENSSNNLIVTFNTSKPFADVIEELDFAITERNFRITGRNTVGKGIRQRGYPDFPNVEVIHFCSLEKAREVLELDPAFVAQMPCRVTIHEAQDQVVISLILLPVNHHDPRVNEFARKMNATLREIVDFVLEES